jgi:hypothetical protein
MSELRFQSLLLLMRQRLTILESSYPLKHFAIQKQCRNFPVSISIINADLHMGAYDAELHSQE